jgi:hypothetical protein
MSESNHLNQVHSQPENDTDDSFERQGELQPDEPVIAHHPDTLDDANNPGGLPPSGGTTTDGGTG